MNYTKDILTSKELSFLLKELNQTKLLTSEEAEKEYEQTHPYILNNESGLYPNLFSVYSTKNETLNSWVSTKFSKNNIVEALYTMDYGKGSFSLKHKDYLRRVTIILLTNDFDGGNFLIEDTDMDLSKRGEYVIFDGHKYSHEVTEIIRGVRKVLVMFFKPEIAIL